MKSIRFALAGVALASLFAVCSAVAQTARMETRVAPAEEALPRVHAPDAARLSALPLTRTISLSEPSPVERNKRAQDVANRNHSVAFGRSTEGSDATIVMSGSDAAVKIAITSASAIHMRVALAFDDAAQYRITSFAPGEEARAVSLYRITDSSEPQPSTWTPLTDGPTQIIVIERLGPATEQWSVTAPLVSHFDKPLYRTPNMKPEVFGDSQPCQVDIICVYQLAPAAMQPGVLLASRAVALMSFTKADGQSYWCTGTMLNTASFPLPVFLTAFHCLSDAQSLASLTTIWFFSRDTCQSGLPSAATAQVAGGAIGIFGNASLDAALVLLHQMPPVNATYAGWDASTMLGQEPILAARRA